MVSGSPELTAAVRAAVLQADSLHQFPVLPKDLYPRHGRFLFELSESLQPLPGQVAIAHLQVRGLEIQVPATVDHPALPPLGAYRPNSDGAAFFQFVIDPTGRANPASLVLLDASYREVADLASAIIRSTTYHPALIDGCPVPSLVHQRVSFTTSR